MFTPSAFKEEDPEKLLTIMQENAFATIVTTDEHSAPVATPLPFLIKKNSDEIKLQAHFAKANPQWKHLEGNTNVLVIFNGPHCYISPSWYKKSGVPMWDYVTVHAYGSAKLFENFQRNQQTAELIAKLTDKYEQGQKDPWKAKNNYPDKMLNAIVGFEIKVHDFQGKVKIGQNKSQEDLEAVVTALGKSSSEQEKSIAKLIKTYLKSKD